MFIVIYMLTIVSKIRKIFYVLCISVFAITYSTAQNKTPEFVSINHFFDSISLVMKVQQIDSAFKEMVQTKRFNGSMLMAKQNKILYSNYSGYADFQTKRRLSASSQYEVASVSKQFTAVAILMLYEQKKLLLTDTVQKYIPDFPYKEITIHQLLCHRSGLPDYFKFAEKYQKDENYIIDNDSLLRMMNVYCPKILEKPNKVFEYSNTGYAVLASIVERISGISFYDFVHKNIFTPLGMKESYFYHYGKPLKGMNTVGHKANSKQYERDFLSGILGDKGIFTTVNDLFMWDNALYETKLLKPETLEMAFSPQNAENSPCSNYGYGWRLSCDVHGNTLIYHGGLWNGNNTLFLKRASDKVLIIFLSNIYNKGFSGKSSDFLSIIDGL